MDQHDQRSPTDPESAPDPEPTASPGPGAAPPPGPPPPPPPPRGWSHPPTGWTLPTGTERPVINIGSILGRTFDTFGREWSLFLVLATPAALGSFLQAVIAPATAAAGSTPTIEELAPTILATALGSLISLLSTVTITAAADALWRGEAPSLGRAVSDGLRALPRYLGVVLLLGLVAAAVGLVAVMLVIGGGGAGSPAVPAVTLGVLLLVPVAIWIGARLTLLGPVIVLEDDGVTGSVRRAWALSKGHAIMLLLLSVAVGVVSALPLWGGSLFAAFVPDAVIAGLALAIATFVSQPLPAIALTLAWGDRIGGRHADSAVMARGSGRGVAAMLVFGLGVILLVIGMGVAARYASSGAQGLPGVGG